MSSTKPTIKPNNHKIHPCPNDKKLALAHDLVAQNTKEDIIVVTSGDTRVLEETLKGIKVIDDKTLIKDKNLTCTLLISFDVPLKAVIYIARLSHTTKNAVLLLNESEQKLLYPIETLLGRVIKQEIVSGYEYPQKEIKETDPKARKPLSKERIKEIAKKNYDEKVGTPKPKSDKPKRDYKKDDEKATQWEKKKKAPNKFLGKDDNGKAIFSGKSGDRNHRYDGSARDSSYPPKKVGRKINIKALKKPKDQD
ncbi:hypothetical protein [Sulfurimonas sp.]|uniref:hypothetical protein n=1 Tax=Sulfurimonas sp. TaxID=2022749 RepID=UPI002AB14222|nr:hypothetical protein [Sulfurimonas sp.]